jgi:hypothetical protein
MSISAASPPDGHDDREVRRTGKITGARVVFSCGFDSIPFDLGVTFLQDQAISRLGAPLQRAGACAQDERRLPAARSPA